MRKSHNDNITETVELLKAVMQNPNGVSFFKKRKLKKLIQHTDPSLLIETMKKIQMEQDPNYCPPLSPVNDSRTDEEVIADNYIFLAKYAIEKQNLKDVRKLKVQISEDCFQIFALTPTPVNLDFEQFATSDYPYHRELLLEAEALRADLFLEDNAESYLHEIIRRIESANLSSEQ